MTLNIDKTTLLQYIHFTKYDIVKLTDFIFNEDNVSIGSNNEVTIELAHETKVLKNGGYLIRSIDTVPGIVDAVESTKEFQDKYHTFPASSCVNQIFEITLDYNVDIRFKSFLQVKKIPILYSNSNTLIGLQSEYLIKDIQYDTLEDAFESLNDNMIVDVLNGNPYRTYRVYVYSLHGCTYQTANKKFQNIIETVIRRSIESELAKNIEIVNKCKDEAKLLLKNAPEELQKYIKDSLNGIL